MQEDSPIQILNNLARRHQIFLEYRFEKESGPIHAKMYTVRVQLGEKDYVATERSLKLAQQAAAQLALNSTSPTAFQSPTIALNTWATQHHIPLRYVFLKEQHRSRLLYFYRLYIGQDLYFDGQGLTPQQARYQCAMNAVYFLRQSPPSPPSTPQSCPSPSKITLMYERAKQLGLPVRMESEHPSSVTYHLGEKYSATGTSSNRQSAKQIAAEKILEILSSCPNLNPITRVYQLAQQRQVKVVVTTNVSEGVFTYQIKFGEKETGEGQGSTKQIAKRAAAENLLEKLDPIVVLPPPPAKGLLKREGGGNADPSSKQEKKHVHFVEEVIEKDEQMSSRQAHVSISNKQLLQETCHRFRIQLDYNDEMNANENAGSSRYQSTVSLAVGSRLLAQFRGHGPSLARAQENASSAAWNNFKDFFHRKQAEHHD